MATNYDKYLNSTVVHYISNSGSDERGQYHGGKAGDQNGSEWKLRSWYNRPWTCVLRHLNPAVALKLAELSIDAPLNNKIGYDQWQRTTYWTQLAKVEYDPAKITVACEADCTAGVSANVKAVGYLLGIKKLQDVRTDTYSGNMKARLKAAGFEVLTAKKYLTGTQYLMPGDVLLYEGHHAAVNVTYGSKVAKFTAVAKTNYLTVTGGVVYVRTGPAKTYKELGIVKKGEKLEYQGKQSDGWYLVKYKGDDAWISGRYSKV